MPKSVEISVPEGRTQDLIDEIRRMDGLISLSVQRRAAVVPPGDLVTIVGTSDMVRALMRLLADRDVGSDPTTSIKITNMVAVIAAPMNEAIAHDENDATLEEIELTLVQESSIGWNGALVMALAGVLGSVGIATSALHLVIAAMVIAAGFEPLSRTGFGLATRSRAWRRSLSTVARGYIGLLVGATVAALVSQVGGLDPRGGDASYLPAGALVPYFGSITVPSVATSAAAGIAGALLITMHRSVLTAGVMIALALIPAMLVMGAGLATADFALAGRGFVRWIVDVALVVSTSYAVYRWNALRQHRSRIAI